MTAATTNALVSRAVVLDETTCAAIAARVHALRTHWVARDEAAFHTLGAALYLDRPTAETRERFGLPAPGPARYATLARRSNALLETHFADLYPAFAAALAGLLDAEVRYAEDRARPGSTSSSTIPRMPGRLHTYRISTASTSASIGRGRLQSTSRRRSR